MAGKLWDKGYEPDKMIEEYTVGDDRELDMRLARYDVEGSLAHIAMLETIGLLTAEELEKLTAGLKEIAAEIEAGRFEIEPGTEDVHSQVELMLTRRLGDAGKKIHSGRSRNDQVLVDLKLFLRDELRQVADAVKRVFDRLQEQSEKYKEVLMPGYTHLRSPCPRRSDCGSGPMPRRSRTTCVWWPRRGTSPTRIRWDRPPDTARRSRSTAR